MMIPLRTARRRLQRPRRTRSVRGRLVREGAEVAGVVPSESWGSVTVGYEGVMAEEGEGRWSRRIGREDAKGGKYGGT